MQWIVVGLGNPDAKYLNTPHNIGSGALDYIFDNTNCVAWKHDKKKRAKIAECELLNKQITLVFPQTYMNNSGESVRCFVKSKNALSGLIVIHDDIDLPFGTIRISKNRGDGGHNGLKSVINCLKTKDFLRVRIGVCQKNFDGFSRKPTGKDAVANFLLSSMSQDKKHELQSIYKKAHEALLAIIKDDYLKAMNKFNS